MKTITIPDDTFVECECGAHALVVTVEYHDKEVYISFWQQGRAEDGRTSLRDKWRLCRQIMKTDHPYTDMVILNPASIRKMIDALSGALELFREGGESEMA